ncbi:MAG: peptide chain release factor N(5)-glutamine methyltransferase [Polyangiales bacterium]
MADTWTIRKVLDWTAKDFAARGIDSPRLDAELLVSLALGIGRVQIYLDLDRPLAPDELTRIRELVGRRRKREPVAYIVGKRDFYGRTFEVTKDVLIPRPDTEILVERALAHLPADEPKRVLDLCTGSGCVAICLAALRASAVVLATDVSEEALGVARRNAASNGVDSRISFHRGDLFEAVRGEAPFDVVTANPPYIPSRDIEGLDPDVASFEPRLALDGGADGLDFYRRLAKEAPARLVDGGVLLVEVGQGQAADVEQAFLSAGAIETRITDDYGKVARVVEARFRAP